MNDTTAEWIRRYPEAAAIEIGLLRAIKIAAQDFIATHTGREMGRLIKTLYAAREMEAPVEIDEHSTTTEVSDLFDSLKGKTDVHLSIEEIGAASGPEPMSDSNPATGRTIEQIIIEQVREDDESTCWAWDVFGVEHRIAGGHAKTLSNCLDSMREYLKDEGLVSFLEPEAR